MPHYVDFSDYIDVQEFELDVIGWSNPLTIEYVYVDELIETKLYWRVKGTAHTFTIGLNEFQRLSKGDTISHFQQTLTIFRDDIVSWAAAGAKEKWMREYIYMFKNHINF